MQWIVYVLKSEKGNKRYIGSTNDITRRFKEHNSGKVLSTKNRRPLNLIYKEEFIFEKDARSRERFFKTHKGFNTLKKLINLGE